MTLLFPAPAAAFLPQEPPMRFLDEALAADDERASGRLTVRADSIAVDSTGLFPSAALLEVMAQTIGVYAGRMRLLAGQRPAAGLLLGTRRAVFSRPGWPVGTRFTAHAAKTWEGDDGLWQFDCAVEAEAPGEAPEPAARAVLTVFNPPENFFDRAHAASARPASQGES